MDLENFVEVYSIHTGCSILDMKIVDLYDGQKGCLFSHSDASLHLWKISSLCNSYLAESADIISVNIYEDIQIDVVAELKVKREGELLDQKKLSSQKKITNIFDSEYSNSPIESHDSQSQHIEYLGNTLDEEFMASDLSKKLMVSMTSQDLSVIDLVSNSVISRMDHNTVVLNSIQYICVSVHQLLLYCLCENDVIKVYCLRDANCPMLKEISIKIGGLTSEDEVSNCLAVINMKPLSHDYNVTVDKIEKKIDVRGRLVSVSEEEFLSVGLKNGFFFYYHIYYLFLYFYNCY